MTMRERLAELERIRGNGAPVTSVYLDTEWRDEHQRDRVRLFLDHELRQARARTTDEGLLEDLRWIEQEAGLAIQQARAPGARGIALFACHAVGLRAMVPLDVRLENVFVIADRPVLTPLAEAAARTGPAVVVFVDGESARLIPLDPEQVADEVVLQHDIAGRHRRGGWAQLAQSRYQRHIEEHRADHFRAVAAALREIGREHGYDRIVLAGDSRSTVLFRDHLPSEVAASVAGIVSGARWEPAAALADRARRLLEETRRATTAEAIRDVLVEAAKGGRAVAGPRKTLEAAAQGAVHRLYVLKGLCARARRCRGCGALAAEGDGGAAPGMVCPVCGASMREEPFAEAISARVIETGGDVDVVDENADLAHAGGVAARLRYPVPGAS